MQSNAQRLHMKGCLEPGNSGLLHTAPKAAGARCCPRRLVKAQAAPALAAPEKRKQAAKPVLQPAQDRQNGASQRAEPAQLREEVLDVDSVLQKELSENGGLHALPSLLVKVATCYRGSDRTARTLQVPAARGEPRSYAPSDPPPAVRVCSRLSQSMA